MAEIFAAVLPSGASQRVPDGADTLPMASYADELARVAPTRVAVGFRAATWGIVLFGALLAGRRTLFLSHPPAERARILDRLSRHRVYVVRELPTLMKVLATMGYFGAPDVQQRLGITQLDDLPPSWMVR